MEMHFNSKNVHKKHVLSALLKSLCTKSATVASPIAETSIFITDILLQFPGK